MSCMTVHDYWSGIRNHCLGDEKTHLSPKVKKRVGANLVAVFVTLWERNQQGKHMCVALAKQKNETQCHAQPTTMRSSEYRSFPLSRVSEP